MSNLLAPLREQQRQRLVRRQRLGQQVRIAQVVVAVDEGDDARRHRHPVAVELGREAAAVGVLVVLADHRHRAGRQAHAPRLHQAHLDVLLVDAHLVGREVVLAVAQARRQLELADVVQHRADAEVLHLLVAEAEAAAHQQRDDADVHRVHRRLVAGALGEHADAQVLLADHLVDDRARQRLGLLARLLRLAGNEVERVAAGARGLAVLARAALLGVALARELARPLGLGALRRMGGGADDVVVDRQRVRHGVDGIGVAEAGVVGGVAGAIGSGPGSVVIARAAASCASGRSAAGSSAPCAGRASGSSPAAPRVVMRKLLSGNGCDIQPMSRWTNMPTRSAWTSISSVGRAFFMGCRGARGTRG